VFSLHQFARDCVLICSNCDEAVFFLP